MFKRNATIVSSAIRRAAGRVSVVQELESRRMMAHQPFGFLDVHGQLEIDGTSGNDVVSFQQRGARTIVVMNGVRAQFTTAGFNNINMQAGDGNDIVDFTRMTIPCYVNLGTGNDIAYGGSGNDSLTGAAGRDTLYGNGGNDRLAGGKTGDLIHGGDGDDVLYGDEGTDLIYGDAGRNHLFGEADNDTLYGGNKSDGLYGGPGADRLFGMAGNDVLSGDDGNDRLYGGVGNDQLTGGAGSNGLYGEAGDDTINAANGKRDDVDGGDGDDTVTDDHGVDTAANVETENGDDTTPVTPPVVDPVVPVGGDLARGVSMSDESVWDSNFSATATKLKTMGVKTVRIWLEVSNFDERPHAYDNVSTSDIVFNWRSSTTPQSRKLTGGLAMKRAFALKAMGFNVIMTVAESTGEVPASAQQVKDFYTFLMNSTLNANGTGGKLKDAVDAWEISEEVDLAANWKPSGTNKTAGLKAYVDDVLIPAASVLHAGGDTSKWEKVISASVSYNPADVNTILTEAKAQGHLNDIDYAGFHPYGHYNTATHTDDIGPHVTAAVKVSKTFGKPLAATEWNIRGYPNDGSQDTQWAAAVKDVYTKYIAPNFGIGIYFSLLDNLDARGGGTNTSARPAGVFKHDASISVTPNSSTADILAYCNSPLVANGPFYSAFDSFFDA